MYRIKSSLRVGLQQPCWVGGLSDLPSLWWYTCEDLSDEEDEGAEPVEHVVHVGAGKRASG